MSVHVLPLYNKYSDSYHMGDIQNVDISQG